MSEAILRRTIEGISRHFHSVLHSATATTWRECAEGTCVAAREAIAEVVDDATDAVARRTHGAHLVEKIARRIAETRAPYPSGIATIWYGVPWDEVTEENKNRFREMARPIVAEIFGEQAQTSAREPLAAKIAETLMKACEDHGPIAPTYATRIVLDVLTEYVSACYDCGLSYTDDGFADLVVSNEAWARISPTGHEGGLLCPTCMVRRAKRVGLSVRAEFRSGPFAVNADGPVS